MRRLVATVLALSLLLPEALLSQQNTARTAGVNGPAAASSSPRTSAQTRYPETVRPTRATHRRSYGRETRSRRHSGISKGEVAFMAAIAGTSMGIGALAGGAKGLAIGAIVGGWGAYAGHRLWKWLR